MSISKSAGIDELLRNSEEQDNDYMNHIPSAPGRRPAEPKPTIKSRNTQAWRKLEDHLDEKRLRHKLKESFED
ncbi:MAG: PA3496 family putative envelope integrity protein [Gammaproteobacteria bacterium]